MRLIMLLVLLPVFASGFAIFGQERGRVSINDFVGTWHLDKEKTYPKYERKKVEKYELQVFLESNSLTIYWDYTIKYRLGPMRNYYHKTYILDGKEKDLRKHRTDSDARAQTASFNGKEIKCRYNYRTDRPQEGGYIDYQTFSFSDDKKYLVVESVYRSTQNYTETETRKLYFLKEN